MTGVRRMKSARAAVAALSLAAMFVSISALAASLTADSDTAPNTTENDAITFDAATWVDLQRVTGADPQVDVDMRGKGRVFVNFPWGRLPTSPTLPNIVARSLDRGRTFRTLFDENCTTSNSQPHCDDPGAGNSTLALSPDSDHLYLSGIVPGFGSLTASASSDVGDTWPEFEQVTAAGGMDRPWLLSPGGQTAYLAWNNLALQVQGQPSVQYATTQDGGASWTVDKNGKYVTPGPPMRLVMDRSPQSPARDTIYQIFGTVDSDGNPTVGIAVSRDATETFETYEVGGGLANPHGNSLPWVTVDSAGNLYAVWWTGRGSDVVMSTSNISDPANDPTRGGKPGSTWSPPVRVSTGAAETAVVGNVVAGSPGNVAIVYYGTSDSEGKGTPDLQPANAEWHAFVAHSSNAHDSSPAFTQSKISDRVIHQGAYCTDGGGGSCSRLPGSHDRGLRNWMNVGMDPEGSLYAAWSDDNNDGNRTGIRFAKQLTGPRLMAGNPPLDETAPSSPMADRSGDATWLNRITGGTNLPGADLTRVAVRRDGTDIRFKLSVRDVQRFEEAVDAVPKAERLLFLVRFQTADQDYFAAYEYSKGGEVRAYTGRIDALDGVEKGAFVNAIAFVANDLNDGLDPPKATATVSDDTITITQKLSAFDSPTKLFSVVGAALIGPSEDNETRFNLLNTIDATRAFDYELR